MSKTVSRPPNGGTCGNCRGTGATTASSTGNPSRGGVVHDQRVCPICGGSGRQTDTEYVDYLDREVGASETNRLLKTLGRRRR